MRKLTILCVIMLLLFSLAGCSSNENEVINENKEIEQVENIGVQVMDASDYSEAEEFMDSVNIQYK